MSLSLLARDLLVEAEVVEEVEVMQKTALQRKGEKVSVRCCCYSGQGRVESGETRCSQRGQEPSIQGVFKHS